MTPCLLGPRHGHLVGERPQPLLALASDKPNEVAYYRYKQFLCDDRRVRGFFIYALATKEQAEKAVDDYVYCLHRGTHGNTWEHRWKKPPDLRNAYRRAE